jgi:hypothetical protein
VNEVLAGILVGLDEDGVVSKMEPGVIVGDGLGMVEEGETVAEANGTLNVDVYEGWKIGKDIFPQERSTRRMNIIKK